MTISSIIDDRFPYKKEPFHLRQQCAIYSFIPNKIIYIFFQARAKLPKKRRRVVNVDLPQGAGGGAGGRRRGGAGGKGKLNQKMGESRFWGGIISKKNNLDFPLRFTLTFSAIFYPETFCGFPVALVRRFKPQKKRKR